MNTWSATALNTAPDSENRIHSDELAKEYGFEGGLVPGVTISAYLVHPLVERWGRTGSIMGTPTVGLFLRYMTKNCSKFKLTKLILGEPTQLWLEKMERLAHMQKWH